MKQSSGWRWICVGLLLGSLGLGTLTGLRSSLSTVKALTLTPESVATATPRPPTATPTATPPPRLHPTPTPTRVVSQHPRRRRRHPHPPSDKPGKPTGGKHPGKHPRRKARHPKPRATPTPTAPINLQTEDSIAPVTCKGPGRRTLNRPFLYPPSHGWTTLVSYFDHDVPTFSRDGLVITATGLRAQPDAQHHAWDFPAYWSSPLRQYIYYDGHNGYDYGISYRPVYAAAAGKVIYAAFEYSYAPNHGYGKMVMIDHRNGYITLYGHFSTLLVKKGQKIRRGQEIGISGNTGHSSGPHLHFTLFHNCSPVDPYGWHGSGSDPLLSYKNQRSTYLWKRAPLILNPAPGWPGIRALPGTSSQRLVLLRLPRTSVGPKTFMNTLAASGRQLRTALHLFPSQARLDMGSGALLISARIRPSRLYSFSRVASIGSGLDLAAAHSDLLTALSRSALSAPRLLKPVARFSPLRVYLFDWQGETFLLGKAPRGRQVSLRFSSAGRRSPLTHKVMADPETGSYAIDLGRLNGRQLSALNGDLHGHPGRHSSLSLRLHASPRHSSDSKRPISLAVASLLLGALLLIALTILIVFKRTAKPSSS